MLGVWKLCVCVCARARGIFGKHLSISKLRIQPLRSIAQVCVCEREILYMCETERLKQAICAILY